MLHTPQTRFFFKTKSCPPKKKKKKEKHRVAKVGPAHPAYLHPLIPSYTTAHNHHQQLQSPHWRSAEDASKPFRPASYLIYVHLCRLHTPHLSVVSTHLQCSLHISNAAYTDAVLSTPSSIVCTYPVLPTQTQYCLHIPSAAYTHAVLSPQYPLLPTQWRCFRHLSRFPVMCLSSTSFV